MTYTVTDTSFDFPQKTLINAKLNIPKTIPSAILYVKGINTMVRNAGKPSLMSLKLILATDEIINKPTIIKAGEVAAAGTIRNNGAKNSAKMKNNAVLTEVSPVRPPDATPDALSTYAVTVLVPSIEPTVVPRASENRAFFI